MNAHQRDMKPGERVLDEVAREEIATLKAVTDYNLMMGNLEDPAEEDEEDE